MNFLTDETGKAHSEHYASPVRDVAYSTTSGPAPVETVTFVTGAAGFKGIINLAGGPILNALGDKVGSFWREDINLMMASSPSVARITGITKTNGSAAVTIEVEPGANASTIIPNLEQLFEVSTGNSRVVIILADPSGTELIGYVRDIAKTGNSYVINVANTLAGGTQNWIGVIANFVATLPARCGFRIHSYESSFAWVTGTVLPVDQEKLYQPIRSDYAHLNNILTVDGDWCVDYFRGRILYRKATTGTSDTCSYKVGLPFFFSNQSKLVASSKTLSANNTTANIPIFRVTGAVRVTKLYGIVTTVLGSNQTAAYWRLNDQTAQVNITLNTGTTVSAAVAGSELAKNGLATAALVLSNSSAGRVAEPGAAELTVKSEFEVIAKSGANTDIEYTYSTTNTPTTGAIQFFVEYQALSADGSIAAV